MSIWLQTLTFRLPRMASCTAEVKSLKVLGAAPRTASPMVVLGRRHLVLFKLLSSIKLVFILLRRHWVFVCYFHCLRERSQRRTVSDFVVKETVVPRHCSIQALLNIWRIHENSLIEISLDVALPSALSFHNRGLFRMKHDFLQKPLQRSISRQEVSSNWSLALHTLNWIVETLGICSWFFNKDSFPSNYRSSALFKSEISCPKSLAIKNDISAFDNGAPTMATCDFHCWGGFLWSRQTGKPLLAFLVHSHWYFGCSWLNLFCLVMFLLVILNFFHIY
jgi:hypothetical protein